MKTEKELLEFVSIFDAMFKKKGEMDMFLDKTVSQQKEEKSNYRGCYRWQTKQEEFKRGRELVFENTKSRYSFELPLIFKEFDTYYTLTKDIVGLDKDLANLKVQGLVATLQYLNPLDERRTKFEYTFELPEISDLESIYITYVDGCLTITVPKLAKKINHYTIQ